MKKVLPIVVIVLILAGVGAFVMANKDSDKDVSTSTQSTSAGGEAKTRQAKKACDVLTLEDAKKVLGENAEKTELPSGGAASSDDIDVTQCIYSQPAGDTLASIKAQKQASILVRSAKTDKGGESNKEVFEGSLKPAEAQDVSGYGDGAFWNPQFGQFNVYKNDNWYIISVGSSTPSEKTLEEAKVLADLIIGKL